MFRRQTFLVLGVILALYAALWLPSLVSTTYLDSPLRLAAVVPVMSVYVFHAIGIPGLLQGNGMCGWGWCAPTLFGWCFLIAVWFIIAWLVAWLIAALISRLTTFRSH